MPPRVKGPEVDHPSAAGSERPAVMLTLNPGMLVGMSAMAIAEGSSRPSLAEHVRAGRLTRGTDAQAMVPSASMSQLPPPSSSPAPGSTGARQSA